MLEVMMIQSRGIPLDGQAGVEFGGGYFVRRMKDEEGHRYALVVSRAAEGSNNDEAMRWLNTENYVNGLAAGGYHDWKMPTRDECRILYREFKPGGIKNNKLYGATDKVDPPLPNYTEENPSQTGLPQWKAGGPEAFNAAAFEVNTYWANDSPGTNNNLFSVDFSNGKESAEDNFQTHKIRAVRRVYF